MTLFQRKIRVLLVCTENICRSPMAEGLLRHYLQESEMRNRVEVSSVGTKASLPGCRPDQRAQKVAASRGIDISGIRARRVTARNLQRSDFISWMDSANMRDLLQICPVERQDKISYLLGHQAGQPLLEVPDPYFGSADGFARVFQIIDDAMADLLSYIRSRIG
ncbi:MAG: low molecular weight phosphotyrosine protein phosphatase [Haliea sp.]|nr:low molecular weight phosphotyrosine protein phosphatase [Haliea sp.]